MFPSPYWIISFLWAIAAQGVPFYVFVHIFVHEEGYKSQWRQRPKTKHKTSPIALKIKLITKRSKNLQMLNHSCKLGKAKMAEMEYNEIKLTPSCPFFLDEDKVVLISFSSLCFTDVVFLKGSGGTEFFSLLFERSGPYGSFLLFLFKTQFLLIILLANEPLSFISDTMAYIWRIIKNQVEISQLQAGAKPVVQMKYVKR